MYACPIEILTGARRAEVDIPFEMIGEKADPDDQGHEASAEQEVVEFIGGRHGRDLFDESAADGVEKGPVHPRCL